LVPFTKTEQVPAVALAEKAKWYQNSLISMPRDEMEEAEGGEGSAKRSHGGEPERPATAPSVRTNF
jgi:hypothetical protein